MISTKDLLVICAFVIAIIVAAFPWQDQDAARSTLKAQGFTRVELTGHSYFACGKDRKCSTFTAVGPSGEPVAGAVGCGWFKGCTVRIDP